MKRHQELAKLEADKAELAKKLQVQLTLATKNRDVVAEKCQLNPIKNQEDKFLPFDEGFSCIRSCHLFVSGVPHVLHSPNYIKTTPVANVNALLKKPYFSSGSTSTRAGG